MAIKLMGQRIAAASGPGGKNNQRILPNSKDIDPSVLLGRAATIQLSLNSATKGTNFDKLQQELNELDTRVQNLENYVTQGRDLVTAIGGSDGVLLQGVRALRDVGSNPAMQGIDYKKTRLAGLVEALNKAAGGNSIIPSAIQTMAKELEQELVIFRLNPVAYAGAAAKGIKDAERLEDAYDLFDEAINPKMEKLRLVAEPLDDPALGTARKQRSEYRGKIPDIIGKFERAPTAGDVTNGLPDILDQAIQLVSGKADVLAQEVRQARMALMTDTDPNTGTLKDTRDKPVFAADWKQIDAATIGLQKMVPMGMALEGQALYDLMAAKRLCEQAKGLVDTIRNTQGSVGTFETDLAALEQDVATAKGKDAPLTKYDDASIKAIDEQLKRFKKIQPTLLAAAAQKTLAEIRKTFDTKKQAADEIANTVSTVEPDYSKWTGWAAASAKGNDGVKEAVNCLYEALKPLKAAMEARPAVKADIERAHTEAGRVFNTLNDEPAAILLAKNAKAGLEQKARQTEETVADLRQRLKVLNERMPVARNQVKQANGDPNQIKAIEDLIKQAGDEIDSSPDAATKTLNRIEQRIDLVYANPAGGVARSRQQLPDVLSAWKSARNGARAGLQTVVSAIGEYAAPNEEAGKASRSLGDTVTKYMTSFTGGADKLEAPIKVLAAPDTSDPAKRKAREEALAEIQDKLRELQAHPLTAQLAAAPFPAARAAPRRLIDTLDWLHYTILTSVQ
jgi:phage shock protein A